MEKRVYEGCLRICRAEYEPFGEYQDDWYIHTSPTEYHTSTDLAFGIDGKRVRITVEVLEDT